MNQSNQSNHSPVSGTAAKLGAVLFVLWGILHIWVGFEGITQYLSTGANGLWTFMTGGSKVPRTAFVHTTDATTAFAHAQLLVNYCIDVAGYGVLGLVVGWMIWTQASWVGYLIGVLVIGICDLAFSFSLLLSGVIEPGFGAVVGPIIWLLALLVTPFGMPKLGKSPSN